MRRILIVVICSALIFCGLAAAQGGFRPKVRTFAEAFADQRRVIGAWCRLDFDGVRLDKNGWTKFAPLTDMSSPEFSSFFVISRYQVQQPEAPTNFISVTFYQLGEFRPESGYTPMNRVETLTFETSDHDGATIIRDVRPMQPQVSRQAAINWLRQQSDAAKSDIDRHPYEQALRALAPPPTAAPATAPPATAR